MDLQWFQSELGSQTVALLDAEAVSGGGNGARIGGRTGGGHGGRGRAGQVGVHGHLFNYNNTPPVKDALSPSFLEFGGLNEVFPTCP